MNHENAKYALESATKRGRKMIPDQWTRVISLSTDNLNNLCTYPISTDLLVG